MEEVFFLSYGGLHWSAQEIEALPRLERRWYVKRMQHQHQQEAEAVNRK